MGIWSYLRLGRGEDATGGRLRHSVVSDAMEALIGAIYLDGGFASAKEFIHRFILNDMEHKKLFYDSKTILQEIVQGSEDSEELNYVLLHESGPDHNKRFEVAARLGERGDRPGDRKDEKGGGAACRVPRYFKAQEGRRLTFRKTAL